MRLLVVQDREWRSHISFPGVRHVYASFPHLESFSKFNTFQTKLNNLLSKLDASEIEPKNLQNQIPLSKSNPASSH